MEAWVFGVCASGAGGVEGIGEERFVMGRAWWVGMGLQSVHWISSFFFQQVRIIVLDGKLYEGEMGWAGVGVPFCLERIWRYKMDACELAAVEGLLE